MNYKSKSVLSHVPDSIKNAQKLVSRVMESESELLDILPVLLYSEDRGLQLEANIAELKNIEQDLENITHRINVICNQQ